MKKITILTLHFGVGGIEKYISSFLKMLENDYEIDLVVTYKLNEKPSFPISNKVNIKYLIDGAPNREEINRALKRKKVFNLIKELFKGAKILLEKKRKTKKAIKEIDSDYIITTRLYETKLVNKLLKKKNIVKILTDHNEVSKKYKKELIKSTTNYDKIVVVNEEIERVYKEELGLKVIYLPNFIDELSDKKSSLDNKNLIAVGRFSEEKGFLDLIDIMYILVKKDPEIKLTLVGDGIQKEEIISKIKELKLEKNIILTGYLNSYEVEKEMLKSSIYLLPSIRESFGLVLLEAMNVGLPIVAFDTSSGAKTLLKEDTGILIENRDKEAFAKKVIELLENRKLISTYSKKSKETVKNYTSESALKYWKNLLKSLENRSLKKVMFISSTGGHLNEMLMLKSMFYKYPYMLITENTPTNKNLVHDYGKRQVGYLIYGTRKHKLVYPIKLLLNCFKSLYYFIKFRPDFVLTTGAHTAGPMCALGALFGKKIIYIETFANSETKTVTGKIVYKFADLFIVQWESMLELYPNAKYGGWIY